MAFFRSLKQDADRHAVLSTGQVVPDPARCVQCGICSYNCPVGIATQKPHLRARLPVDEAAERLNRFLRATVELMQILARACGHTHLREFSADDLTTFDREMAHLTGIAYGGVTA